MFNFRQKLKGLSGWSWEAVCLLAYLALAGNQLFVRPIVGMADNGDFPKALGPFSLCDPDNQRDLFAYVYPRFIISDQCFWEPNLPSSELMLVRIVKLFAELGGKQSFRMMGIGKAHLAIVLAALMVLLWALHDASPALRFGLPPVVILIFSDVAYVSYLNSLYMDAASMVFLLLTVALAGAWVMRPRTWVPIAFGIAGVLMALSKTQHTLTGLLLAAMAAWYARQAFQRGGDGRRVGWYWSVAAAAVALAAAATIALTPAGYKTEPLYSLIFSRMTPELSDRAGTLAELGLPSSDLKYFGTHAYSPDAAIADLQWRIKFMKEITYTRLAAFYLRNPRVTLHLIERTFREDLPGIRPRNLGNYLREDGFPPGTLAQRFDWWTNLRAWLLWIFPVHLVIFYLVLGIGSMVCFFRPAWAARWPLYPLVMVLTASGVVEFLFPVLLDGTETARHLFFFHVITEVLIVCMVAGVLSAVSGRLSRRSAAHPSDSL